MKEIPNNEIDDLDPEELIKKLDAEIARESKTEYYQRIQRFHKNLLLKNRTMGSLLALYWLSIAFVGVCTGILINGHQSFENLLILIGKNLFLSSILMIFVSMMISIYLANYNVVNNKIAHKLALKELSKLNTNKLTRTQAFSALFKNEYLRNALLPRPLHLQMIIDDLTKKGLVKQNT